MKKIYATLTTLLALATTQTFAQWTKVTDPEVNQSSNFVLSNQGKLYVAVNSGVFVSTDNAVTWTNTNSKAASSAMAPKILVAAGNSIYAAGVYGGSGDFASPLKFDGQSWAADTAGLPQAETKALFSDGSRLFIARSGNTSLSLYTRLDNETSWTATSIPVPNAVFAVYKLHNTYYAVTGGYRKIWSSTDGVSFTETSSTVPVDARTCYSAADAIYFGSENGLFKSTDGLTFNRIDVGFSAHNVLGVGINAVYANGNDVYASVAYSDSVYKSTDGGATWNSISDGELTNTVTSIAVHNNAVFATQATWGADKAPVIRYGNPSSGLFEREANSIRVPVYPNPSSSLVNIGVKADAQISLYGVDGSLKVTTTGRLLDVSSFAPGIYFLRILTSEGSATSKLIVE